MGICVSFNRKNSNSPPTVKIVTINGELREYKVPVFASQVLESESSSSSSSSYFICDSDSLNYDDFIPQIESSTNLQADQIYFILPISKRLNRLTASDMAALAVKASVAIQKSAGKESRRRKKVRISPVMMLTGSNDLANGKGSESTVKIGRPLVSSDTTAFKVSSGYYNRSGSVRNLRRLTSKRAKLAVRSFRLKLSTIYEGSVA